MTQLDRLLLDACQCINLAAADLLLRAAPSVAKSVHVVPQVAREALYLHGIDGEASQRVELAGVDVVQLNDDELDMYVRLAATLDDGEAATIAVAAQRHWILGTDDRAALRAADRLAIPLATMGTTELIRRCADSLSLVDAEIRRVIGAIETRARYVPRQDDPHLDWWVRFR